MSLDLILDTPDLITGIDKDERKYEYDSRHHYIDEILKKQHIQG